MKPEALLEIAAEANHAPSVHNTQPVRWSMDGADGIVLSLDPARRLAIADPGGRDARLSGGAALHGTRLALWRRGIGLRGMERDGDRVRLALGGEAEIPPDLALLRLRTSYRAGFAPADAKQKAALATLAGGRHDVVLVTALQDRKAIARLNDEASLKTMRDRAFRDELRAWMRLRPNDPNWSVDGLSAEALAMNRMEARAAGYVLRTPFFEALDGLGLGRGMTAEERKTLSATGLLAVYRPQGEDRWTTGEAFYDLWIDLTRAGFAAWPMAVLADDAEACRQVAKLTGRPDGSELVTVLRVGPHPGPRMPAKARRPAEDLVREA